ncbi:MAG: phage integrase N-terminal SAM-like domain-containing protein, partial [Ferruginibacter sp.]
METIVLKSIYHRGGQCIAMYCKPERVLVKVFKDVLKAMWSKTNTAWYLESTKENYDKILRAFKNIAIINDQRLEEFKSTNKESSSFFSNNFREKKQSTHITINESASLLSDENFYAYKKFVQKLELKGYSKSTIRTYSSEFIQLLNVLKNYSAESLSVDRIKDYLHYCVRDLKLSEATIHSRINALKFYYEQVLNRDHFFLEIPRPKKRLQIPKVVSKEQIAILINSIENTKHKTIIMLAYACGLRVSEVVS